MVVRSMLDGMGYYHAFYNVVADSHSRHDGWRAWRQAKEPLDSIHILFFSCSTLGTPETLEARSLLLRRPALIQYVKTSSLFYCRGATGPVKTLSCIAYFSNSDNSYIAHTLKKQHLPMTALPSVQQCKKVPVVCSTAAAATAAAVSLSIGTAVRNNDQ